MRPIRPSDDEISDYIEGALDAKRRSEIAGWLEQNPARAVEVERQRQLNEALQHLGADILREPVPERLHNVLRAHAPPASEQAAKDPPGQLRPGASAPPPRRRWFGLVAAGVALLAAGGMAGWLARGSLAPSVDPIDVLLADASYAFAFYSTDRDHAIQFLPDEIERFREVSAKMFERSIAPPDLAAAGYTFRGARIAPTGRQTSTFFFFEGEGGNDLSVIFWSELDEGAGPAGFWTLDDIVAQYWSNQGLGFAVLGYGDERTLRRISERVVSFYESNLTRSGSS